MTDQAPADLSASSVGQLLIPVEDLAGAITFYRDRLGLRFLFAAPPQMSFFQCGGVRLLIGVPEAGRARQRGATVYFQVADIHADIAPWWSGACRSRPRRTSYIAPRRRSSGSPSSPIPMATTWP